MSTRLLAAALLLAGCTPAPHLPAPAAAQPSRCLRWRFRIEWPRVQVTMDAHGQAKPTAVLIGQPVCARYEEPR